MHSRGPEKPFARNSLEKGGLVSIWRGMEEFEVSQSVYSGAREGKLEKVKWESRERRERTLGIDLRGYNLEPRRGWP